MKMSRYISSAIPLGALLALSVVEPVQAAPAQPPLPEASIVEAAQAQPGYWHGYHGYRIEHAGTRRHSDGYWYPDAAFGVDRQTTGSISAAPVQPMHRQTYCQGTFGGTNGDGSMPCGDGW